MSGDIGLRGVNIDSIGWLRQYDDELRNLAFNGDDLDEEEDEIGLFEKTRLLNPANVSLRLL